jgi:hypothetical protein
MNTFRAKVKSVRLAGSQSRIAVWIVERVQGELQRPRVVVGAERRHRRPAHAPLLVACGECALNCRRSQAWSGRSD